MEADLLRDLKQKPKRAIAETLSRLETAGVSEMGALLDHASQAPSGFTLGVTGPPGVGKSSLLSHLIKGYRKVGKRVAVLAVDPSSKRTSGALLGDRIRFNLPEGDHGVFVRSLAARDRLGGLSELIYPYAVLLRAIFDIVLIETVGVGQSETEISEVADTVIFAVQPASGDSIQFMKSGIAEIPDIIAITKADLGRPAEFAYRELRSALRVVQEAGNWQPPVVKISSLRGEGIDELFDAFAKHQDWLNSQGRLFMQRREQSLCWLKSQVLCEFGRQGFKQHEKLFEALKADPQKPVFTQLDRLFGADCC